MTTINAGGGDYQGLPTKPVKHRNAPRPGGLDWAALDANYVANGGILDPDVWPKTAGKVVLRGTKSRNRDVLHTVEEVTDADYTEARS